MIRRDCNSAMMGQRDEDQKRKLATTTLEVGHFYEPNKITMVEQKKRQSHGGPLNGTGSAASSSSFFKTRQSKIPPTIPLGAPRRSSNIFRLNLG